MQGHIRKLLVSNDTPVKYKLPIGDTELELNNNIGNLFTVRFTGDIRCINCGAKIKKSYSQGYCYPCFLKLPQTDVGVINPEKNMAHLGISRDMEWSKQNDLIDHYVYLAISSGLKVGVTRHTQIPTRWIDQGAVKAIKLAKTPYRNLAGQIEVALKSYFKDKTNWRAMLTNKIDLSQNLTDAKQRATELLPENLKQYICSDNTITHIEYPVEKYPAKVKSINLDKEPEFSKTLTGIKGQYLMFDNEYVINIRKYGGYELNITINK